MWTRRLVTVVALLLVTSALAVSQRIHVNFKSVLHKFIDQDWLTRRGFDRVLDELRQAAFLFDESHCPPAQHE